MSKSLVAGLILFFLVATALIGCTEQSPTAIGIDSLDNTVTAQSSAGVQIILT